MVSNVTSPGFVRHWVAVLLFGALPFNAGAVDEVSCDSAGIALQVLGSGGPIADDGRASSGYVVWVNGMSRYLIDIGGGTFLRFAEAGASFADLELIAISHFHADHSSDLPAILKSGYFAPRERALTISGPGPGGPFPALHDYVNALLNSDNGAYGYLSGYLDGSGGLSQLEQVEVKSDQQNVVAVLGDASSDNQVDAMHVPHGIVPALAYRVRIGDKSIVFASDQNGSNVDFIDFAKNASILVMHIPVPEGVTGAARQLHAPPSIVGDIAAAADVEKLVLSHFMARSLRGLGENVSIIRSRYDGPIHISNDLDCIALDD